MRKYLTWLLSGTLCWLLVSLPASADSLCETIERATPAYRVIHLLNYFDTCRAVTQYRDDAFRVLHEVDQLGAKMRDERLRRYCRYLKDTYAKHQQTNAQNAAHFLAVGQRATDDGDPLIAAVCRHVAGQFFFDGGEYGKAFEHLLAANKAFRAIGYEHFPGVSRYLYELAHDYYSFAEYEKTIGLLTEAVGYPPYNARVAIQTYSTMGMAQTLLAANTEDPARFAEAERSYLKVVALATRHREWTWVRIATENLADVYERQRQWAKSLRCYLRGYRIGLQVGDPDYVPGSEALNIASLQLRLGRPDSGAYYLDRALRLQVATESGNRFEDETYQRNYYDVARRYHRAMGDLPGAYAFLDSLVAVDEQISQRYKADQVSLARKKLLIQQHQSEVEALEMAKKAEQTQFWLAIAGLVLLAGLFLRLYYLSQVRSRQARVIEAEKEKSLRLQKQIVEDELRQAQADLAGFMDNLRQKDELIDAITARLEAPPDAPPASGDTRSLLQARQDLIHSSLLTHDDWDEFRRRFERVHPGFFWRLKARFPDLSPADERLLALSQLRLDSRQMSRMLGISPSSLRMARYRLRKKTGIDGHSSLAELLDESSESDSTR